MWSAALLESVGRFAPSLRCELAVLRMHLRSIYLDPATWHVFEDVLPSLTALDRDGWKHAVLSNHVPELAQSMSHLGIRDRFVDVFSSASLGFEKPNARAFHHARQALGDPEVPWMVGDSYAVDVAGANRAGLPAVLLRSRHDEAKCQCDSLIDLADVLAA
jgi:putative hydrolase of the HAD superfamily